MIKENIEEVMKFAKGYSNLHKDSKMIVNFLIGCENNSFVGTQTSLMEKCGHKIINYINEDTNRKTNNLGQFRKLGIIELADYGILRWSKIEGKRDYEFSLTNDWIVKVMEIEN